MPRTPARARPPAPFAWNAPSDAVPGGETLHARFALAIAAVLATVLLALSLGPHRVGDYMTETDFYGAYAEGARLLQQGRFDVSRYGVIGPGYEVLLALVSLPLRDPLLAAELIAAAATVATLLLWAALVRRRVNPLAGTLTALFLATNATFVRYGWAATTDAAAIALQAAALFVLLTRASPRAAAAAGALAALAFLTRYNAIALLPAGLVAIALGGTLHGSRRAAALAFGAAFAIPAAAWIAATAAAGGAAGGQLHHNLAYEVFARARGIAWDDYQRTLQSQFPTLASVWSRDPAAVLGRLAFNGVDHLRLDARLLLGLPVAVCAALGLAFAALDGTLRRAWPLLLAGALLFATLVPVFHSPRYSLALLPVYAMLAAIAFASPRLALVFGRSRRAWLKPALALLPLALAAREARDVQARVIDQLPLEVLEGARALRALAAPGDRVMARKPHLAHHAGVAPAPFPFADSLGALARAAREGGVRWLWFSWPELETRPRFAHLLDTSGAVPGLVPRVVTARHPAVLYEIVAGFGAAPAWYANDTLRALHQGNGRLLVHPTDTLALLAVGHFEQLRGRAARARELAERAVRLVPADPEAHLLLGEAALAGGDPATALQAFARSEALEPGRLQAREGRGAAALALGDVAQAAVLWREIVSVTRDPATLRAMIRLYDQLGDAAAAAAARARLAALGATP